MRSRTVSLMLVAFALLGTACARSPFGAATDVTANVGVSIDSVLRVAQTELRSQGYQTVYDTSGIVFTMPRDIPENLRDSAAMSRGQQWVVQVTATNPRFFSGTRVRVAGFIVPTATTQGGAMRTASGDSTRTNQPQNAIPISEENAQLFAEVRSIHDRIVAAANRRR
ncbi:MAG TPA: hypothetical protein VKA84_06105 [Gemmatimonadaceae bacterium]|nr:hypothetical protein [Gemmatimonadaceae bacterium]